MSTVLPENITVIIRLTNHCNLSCGYCYSANSRVLSNCSAYITPALVKLVCEQFLSLPVKSVEFNWHGGEPTLCDAGVLRNAVETQRSLCETKKVMASNKIQTNGVFLSEEWLELLKEYPIDIGISLDGIAQTHDAYRLNIDSTSSFSTILNTIYRLRENDIPVGGVLTVITEKLAQFANEVYDFFISESLACDFLPCFLKGSDSGEILSPTISPDSLTIFLKQIFDRWMDASNGYFQCRYLENFVSGFIGIKPDLCSFRHSCNQFFSVDTDGLLYPCELFLGEQDMLLGDLKNQPIKDIINSSQANAIFERMLSVSDSCRRCKWWVMCGGGCTFQRGQDNTNDGSRYFFCKTRKSIFQHIENFFEKNSQLMDDCRQLLSR